MRKLWFPLTVLAAVLLSACGQPAAPAATATPVTPTKAAAAIATSAPARCTVESTLDKIGPTQDNRFAPITDADWTLGPADAKVTFLEFSDFM